MKDLALAHEAKGDLAHGSQVSTRADTPLFAHNRRNALVEHLDQGECDLGSASGVTLAMDPDPGQHGGPHVLFRHGLSDSRRVVVDEVSLELAGLFLGQYDLRELANAGVDSVHDLTGCHLLVEHTATDANPLEGVRRELHRLPMARHALHVFQGERLISYYERHPCSPM